MGDLPLCNAFGPSRERALASPRFPVQLVMCANCRLLQLNELVDRELLFSDYPWTSSSSKSAIRYAAAFARDLAARSKQPGFALEIASNDGTVLAALQAVGYSTLGVEPSGLADEATARGLRTVRAFFTEETGGRIRAEYGEADLIVARNVLGHVSDLRGLLAGVEKLLAPKGKFVVEVPYAGLLRDRLQYDTVFHEHVSYFTVKTLRAAIEQCGLVIVRIGLSPLNGGSLVCTAMSASASQECEAAGLMQELERLNGLNEPSGWDRFRSEVEAQRIDLLSLLGGLAETGAKVMGYGAAAKTMALLNYCGVDASLLTAIADGSHKKQGLWAPGIGIPVVAPEELIWTGADCLMIGPWNLADEIISDLREMGYRGRMIVPLPWPTLMT